MRRRHRAAGRVTWASILLCATWNTGLCAGERLVEGTRIRVERSSSPRQEPITGTFLRLDSMNLTLEAGQSVDPMVIPAGQIAGIAVSDGRARRKGAGIGALVGLGLAGVLTAVGGSGSGEKVCSGSGCGTLFLILSVPCVGAGAAVGAAVAPERWREVPFPRAFTTSGAQPLAVELGPVPAGGAIRVSWRF